MMITIKLTPEQTKQLQSMHKQVMAAVKKPGDLRGAIIAQVYPNWGYMRVKYINKTTALKIRKIVVEKR